MIYFTYRDLKLQLTKWLTLNFNMEGGITFQLSNLTPYTMIYIIYRVLKIEMAKLIIFYYSSGGEVNFQRWNLTPVIMMELTCHNFEDKYDQIAYI